MWYTENFLSPDVTNTDISTKTKIKDLKDTLKPKENPLQKKIDFDFFNDISIIELQKNISISKDWEMLIFWYSLEFLLEKWVFITPELLELKDQMSKQIEQKDLLLDIVEIWIEKADEIKSEMWLKSFRLEDNFLQKRIDNISKVLKDINIPMSDEIFNNFINYIFNQFEFWEEVLDIVGMFDIHTVRDTFFNKELNREQKLVKIYDQMRYRWLTWNSKTIKEKLSNEIIQKDDFKDIRVILDDESVIDLVKIWDKDWFKISLEKINFWDDKKDSEKKRDNFALDMIKKYKEISIKTKELNKDWKILENINSRRAEQYMEPLTMDEIIDIQIAESFNLILKYGLIKNQLELMDNRWDENIPVWLYADMIWLWENKSFDLLNIEDENVDTAIDLWTTIAVWVLTMWAWSMAIKWWQMMVKAVNTGTRLNKIVQLVPQLSKLNSPVGKFVWKSVLDWVSFHEWATLMSNLLYKDIENIWEWTMDMKNILKSIVFMWALNWLSYVSKIPWYQKINNFSEKIPEQYLWKKWAEIVLKSSWLMLTWWTIYTISGMIDKAFWEWWQPTVKEYLEFVALIAVFQKIHK